MTPESKPKLTGRPPHPLHVRGQERNQGRPQRRSGFFPDPTRRRPRKSSSISAHYDHVGVDDKGEIFNGSDDNASGTSALLEIAEAFGDGPRPARSVAFLWVSGEEKGLLGSQWFSDHVTLPEGYKIIADINLDMVSRNDGKSIGITPSDKHADYSTLVTDACAAAKLEGLTTKFDADEFYCSHRQLSFRPQGHPDRVLLLRSARRLPPTDRRLHQGRFRESRPRRPLGVSPRLASRPGEGRTEEDHGRIGQNCRSTLKKVAGKPEMRPPQPPLRKAGEPSATAGLS